MQGHKSEIGEAAESVFLLHPGPLAQHVASAHTALHVRVNLQAGMSVSKEVFMEGEGLQTNSRLQN